jgi:hypothetical protein
MQIALAFIVTGLLVYACSGRPSPTAPTAETMNAHVAQSGGAQGHPSAPAATLDPHSVHASLETQTEDKGYLDGWFDGSDVHLYYTKSYFCAEPPSSGAPTNCEIGEDAQIDPRPGPIPTIYAIVAAGIHPDPATLACPAGSVCLNHPSMIDASRVLGPRATSVSGLPHSHILTVRRGGWFRTVNIRVFNLDAWNAIAAAKTLAKVRELQGDPATGRPGIISADTPTNIFFFIASWRPEEFRR